MADFEAGIRSALERLLVSPDFLFRIEADPPFAKAKDRAPHTASPTWSWHRACRSFCGAAFPTTSCSTWRFEGS